MMKQVEYRELEEMDVYLLYIDQCSAKARRYSEQERSSGTIHQTSKENEVDTPTKEDNHPRNEAFIQHPSPTIKQPSCEVCGCNTHRHSNCKVRWKDKSTMKRPELDRYEMAKLTPALFDRVWESACTSGCLKRRSIESRSNFKTQILGQRSPESPRIQKFNERRGQRLRSRK